MFCSRRKLEEVYINTRFHTLKRKKTCRGTLVITSTSTSCTQRVKKKKARYDDDDDAVTRKKSRMWSVFVASESIEEIGRYFCSFAASLLSEPKDRERFDLNLKCQFSQLPTNKSLSSYRRNFFHNHQRTKSGYLMWF